MEKTKKDLLEKTYQQFMQVCFNELDLVVLEDIADKLIMGFGTTFDEKVFSLEKLEELLRSQQTQSEGLKMTWNTKLLHRHISADENTAVHGDDVFLHIQMDHETIEMYLRVSVVLEYTNDKWLVVHWHASKPEEVESEKDTFGIDTWKEKAEALEKVVAERTADLVVKNRELEIEAVLEKVRSRSLAMHKSEEIGEVVWIIIDKMKELGIDAQAVSLSTFIPDSKNLMHWYANAEHPGKASTMFLPYFDDLIMKDCFHAKETGMELFAKVYSKEEKNNYFNYAVENSEFRNMPEDVKKWVREQPFLSFSFAIQGHTGIFMEDYAGKIFSEEENKVLIRFAKVFEQSYIRFLDLQKAEEQTRTAQIELAVERVRAKALAMHSSTQILDVVSTLRDEMLGLEIPGVVAATIYLQEEDGYIRMWDLSSVIIMEDGFHVSLDVKFKLEETDPGLYIRRVWNNTKNYFVEKQEAADMVITLDWLRQYYPEQADEVEQFLDNTPWKYLLHPTIQLAHGKMSVDILDTQPPAEMESIMIKMGAAFDLAYKRFSDLQQSEKQIREGKIELALERVRARTMAMQNSEELSEVSFLLDTQVRSLGIKTQGCAFNIYGAEESTEWFSNEVGTMPAYKTPMKDLFLRYYEAGKNGELIHIEKFEGETCVAHYEYLCTIPGMGEGLKAMIEAGGSFPIRQTDHVVYFKYGYVLFLTLEDVPEAHDIFIRFAKVFEQTYTRFLDLQKAEAQMIRAEQDLVEIKAARKKAEETLVELQSAQKQLIQSEKMASLGELTAGIAHEIQNPLNFVNNFSEVNKEMIIELKEELDKGNYEDVKLIANDIESNEDKINHHGKRADAIVKGMLQHSQSSKGQKESTDINALCDEYLRLSYHGLRAKDKSFNATLKTDYDESIGKVNIIPQDMGRVILNLITNAFYAVAEKKTLRQAQDYNSYEPTVSISTKRIDDQIEIKIADNGNGIPQNIVDKIFQPFFTTKPTGSGTGLGLSLAFDIIKAHGGHIRVESKNGVGTNFIIQLPLS